MRNVFKQFGERVTGSFRERFDWSIIRLTVFYSITLVVMLAISGVISYTAFSQRVVHRFRPVAFEQGGQIVIAIAPQPPTPTAEDVQHDLVMSFLVVNISLLALAIALSYWLAKRTLAPIERAYEEQERFLSDVSHELRTPLAILQMDLEAEGSASAHSRLEEVHRMSTLVADILHLSRIEERAHATSPIQVRTLVETIVDRLSTLAESKDVRLVVEGLDIRINANEDLLTHALTNLIQNAIIYNTEQGTVTIQVSEKGSNVSIVIEDTGVGIAPDDLSNIFKRFYRVDASRTRATGGSGLGLSIVERAIVRMGGSIDITSVVDKGTTVTVTLPK